VRRVLASLTRLAHYSSFIFIVIGWALPWWQSWLIHAPFVLITRIHWRLNERRCIFTTWEVQLLGGGFTPDHEEGWFVKEVFEKFTGWRPATEFTRRLMLVWMYGGVTISLVRLWLHFG
jgi:hypothetical protein